MYTPSVFKQNIGEEIYKHVTRVLGRDPYAGFKEIDQYTMTKAGSPFLMVTEVYINLSRLLWSSMALTRTCTS